ncbi:hypothetical protein D2E41_26590 [Mycobacteroides abscessus]|nr:hypothetical protein D2E41_26590 [Mycobacteroides abscessus]
MKVSEQKTRRLAHMAIRTMVYLACDDCLNIEADTTSDSSDEARAIGAAFGWVRRSRRDLCPKKQGARTFAELARPIEDFWSPDRSRPQRLR